LINKFFFLNPASLSDCLGGGGIFQNLKANELPLVLLGAQFIYSGWWLG
jgi:hypothetical protein